MKRILILLFFLAIAGIAVVAGYAMFGDLSPPTGTMTIPVEIDQG